MNERNITGHRGKVGADDRASLLGQRGVVVWLTGLSGSGKSTIAYALEHRLVSQGHLAYVLDGDNLRHGLNADLAFSPEDRTENIRRAGAVAALMADAGVIVIAAFISPYRDDRAGARRAAGEGRFVEVFIDAPVAVCEARDPKGLYRQARRGEIAEFTGVSAPYEPPTAAEIVLGTAQQSVSACVEALLRYLCSSGFVSGDSSGR